MFFDAFFTVLALLMTLAMLMSPGSLAADYAYAGNETSSSVRVATFDQLSDALGNDEVSDIIIDPQAAKELADDKNTDGITFGGSDSFYIPVESPLVVSHDVTISSEEAVTFARSGKGGDGRYDSSAFRGQSKETPALFNVEQGKTLTLDADITITGEEVSSSFDEDRASFEFTVKSGDGICFIYTKGGSVVMNEGVLLTGLSTDGNTKAPVYIDGTDGPASLEINGAEITDNSLVQTEGGKSTAGGVMLRGANASAELRKGEISGNSADVAGVIVKEGAGLNVDDSFGIDEKDIYEEKAAKETSDEETVTKEEAAEKEESGKKEVSKDAAEETAAAPKRTLKSTGSPALRNGGDSSIKSSAGLKAALATNTNPIILDSSLVKDNKYYFPIDEPLTISRAVEIQTANGKEIIITRSDKFEAEANTNTPAIFNVTSGGNLTLNGNIVMSGKEVEQPKIVKMKLSAGNKYFGIVEDGYGLAGKRTKLAPVDEGSAIELTVDDSGYLLYVDGSTNYRFMWNFYTSTQDQFSNSDFKIKALATDTTLESDFATTLDGSKTYVAATATTNGDQYITYDSSSNSLGRSGNLADAIRFTAEPISGEGEKALKVNDKTGDDAWTKEKVLPGGYFIYATGGGKVTLNNSVTLQDLNTAADVPDAAPVYIGGEGSKLNLAGAEIKNNLVGYAGGDESNSSKMVKDYDNYDIEEFVEGTTPTNSVGGIILDDKATAEFTSGKVNSNRADVGAILVKNEAELEISGTEEGTTINGNVGFHHAGAVQVESGGKVRMNGGTMSNNVAWYKGGAVWATEWGTNGYAKLNWSTKPFPTLENPANRTVGGYFSMAGGSLKNNMAFKRAGAIEVESNNVYLKSGEISGNTTRSLGGAIYVEGDNTTYTYTLLIENGYIGNNKAVKPATRGEDNNKINRYLDGTGKLTEASASNPSSHDHDFTKWGAAGNGGGVWLCPRGGTASFTGHNVIIDNNTKERNGTDLFLQPGYGSVMLQDMKGYWKNENTNAQIETNGVYNGPLPLQNYGSSANGPNYSEPSSGLIIKNNLARDGGGIAANGTVIFGSAKDEFRYDARVNIHKTWDNVPANKREAIRIQVGYGDPANEKDFTILDTTLLKCNEEDTESQNIEIVLDGTNSQNGDFSDSVLAETSSGANADQWTGYVTVPAAINGMALYKFEAPPISQLTNIPSGKFTSEEISAYNGKTELDPSKPSDLKYLYYIAEYHKNLLKVIDGTSKVKIRETNTRYDKTYNLDLTVDDTKTTARETTLIEPASGTVHGSFNTCFTSISVGLGVTNRLKAIQVPLTKIATDSTNGKKWIKNAKFIVVEAQLNKGENWDFSVAGESGNWNPTASDDIKSRTILDVAQKDSEGEMVVYTSGNDGLITIQNLQPDRKYFLFEYEPQVGYVATSSPWIIDVAASGTATVVAVDPEAKYRNQPVINKVITNRPRNNEKLEDFIVNDSTNTNNRIWHAYWRYSWYYNSDGTAKNPVTNSQIGNSTADIKIIKVDNQNEPVENAVFAFADVGYEPNSNKTKVFYSQAGVIRKDSRYLTVTSDDEGKIDITPVINALDPSSNGNAGQGRMEADSIWLWMFEIEVSDNYKQKTAPWLINIAKDKTVKIYEYNNPYVYPRSPIQKNNLGNWVWDNEAVNGNNDSQVRNIPLADFNFSTNAQNDHPVSTSNGTADAKVKNNKRIRLTKVDGKTGEVVQGTKFRLYKADKNIEFDENGDLATTGTIGVESVEIGEINAADGTVDIGVPAAGTYLLFETKAASGYERRKEPWLIHVNADGSYRMAIYDYDYLSFYGKKDEQSTANEWYARSVKSDALNSWSKLSGYLGDGRIKYYLKSEKTNRFTELDGEGEKGKLKNKPMDLKLFKKSSEDNKALVGVEFDLYNATKEEVNGHWEFQVHGDRINGNGQLVSGADGSFTLPTLEPGHIYMLFEKKPAPGYQKPTAPWGIEVDGDGVVKVWRLKKSGDAGYNATSAAQYSADTNPSQVVILCTDMIQTGSHEIENDRKPIELLKVDENGDAITSGATFVLTKANRLNGSVNWFVFEGRAWDDRTLLTASQIGFKESNARTYTTNDSGKLVIEDLPGGNYLLFEISAPTGFDRTRTPWLITVTDNETGRAVHVSKIADDHKNQYMDESGKTQTIPETAGDQQKAYGMYWPGGDTGWFEPIQTNSDGSYSVMNEPKYIIKVDSTTAEDEDPVVLANVEFDLYPAFVQTYNGTEVIRRANDSYKITDYEFRSDSMGRIKLPAELISEPTAKRASGYDNDVYIQGYMLVEKQAPEGYKAPAAPWWITVDESGNISVKTTSRAKRGDAGPASNRLPYWQVSDFTGQLHGVDYGNRIGNTPAGIAQLTKVDGNTTTPVADSDENPIPLKGAKFKVYKAIEVDKYDKKRRFYVYKDDGYVGETTESDEHGRFTLPDGVKAWNYSEGNYYVIYEMEDHVPEGYAHAKEPWLVTVHYDSETDSYYGETWSLTGISGQTNYYHLKNYENPSIECNDHVQNFPVVELTKVDLDTVNVTTAPNDTGREVISLKNDTVRLNNVGFQLCKVKYPDQNGDWTQGDRVTIESEDDQGITWTDQNGVLKLGVLSDGRYLLYERQTVDGYILPDKPWRIWIQQGKISKVERHGNGTAYIETDTHYLTNSRIYSLPSSGGMGTYWFMVIGAMMMGFAATAAFTRMNIRKVFRR